MEAGQCTPIAMKRPLHWLTNSPTICDSKQTALPPNECLVEDQRVVGRPNRLEQRRTTSKLRPDSRDSHIAKILICTTITSALGWGLTIYSRTLAFNFQNWAGLYKMLRPSIDREIPFSRSAEWSELPCVTQRPQASFHDNTTTVAAHTFAMNCGEIGTLPTIRDAPLTLPQRKTRHRVRDPSLRIQALLCKHFNYLLPWISDQPLTTLLEENADDGNASSEIPMADDFRWMPLRSFVDLSTAIYRDVRRREKETSFQQPQPDKLMPCTTTADLTNSRMTLCRTINEQYHRLVIAVVLEQARRVAEIRIRGRKRGLLLEG